MSRGFTRLENVRTEAPFLEASGPEVLDHDVRRFRQREDDLLGLRIVKVKGDRPLSAALDERPEGPMPADSAAPIPERIAALWMFDLDDVRAVVREQPSGERARDQRP